MAIDWDTFSKTLGYVGEKEMWERLYGEGLSITQLVSRLGVSRNTVRERMAIHGVVPRKRGGPNHVKAEITDAVIQRAVKEGIGAVAAELNVDYNTLYKRCRPLLKQQAASQADESQPTPDSPPSEKQS